MLSAPVAEIAVVTTRLLAVNARRRLAPAVLLLAAAGLSACDVNFDAQTDQVYNPGVGVNEQSGDVDVLNALVVSGTEGSGTVIATLVNNNEVTADSLRGIAGADPAASLQVTPGGPTAIPAGGLLNLAEGGRNFVRGEQVKAGDLVTLTFTFQRAEAITLDAPVVAPAGSTYSGVTLPPAS
jgi:hypothetical protein